MFRLVSINTLALLIISPLLVASATAEQGGVDTALNSLRSVVSYRGVRITAVHAGSLRGELVLRDDAAA